MKENPYRQEKEEMDELLRQYNNFKTGKKFKFIEEESFLRLVDYFDENENLSAALEAVDFAVRQYPYSSALYIRKADILIAFQSYQDALFFLEKAEIIEIESGEENKNIEICAQIWRTLSELGADRKSLLINLGGGVIIDLGGFVASTFKRGIDFINIPTTLLAQVDASIGGKTGIDLDYLKNEIGVFNAPKAVFIYPPWLKT